MYIKTWVCFLYWDNFVINRFQLSRDVSENPLKSINFHTPPLRAAKLRLHPASIKPQSALSLWFWLARRNKRRAFSACDWLKSVRSPAPERIPRSGCRGWWSRAGWQPGLGDMCEDWSVWKWSPVPVRDAVHFIFWKLRSDSFIAFETWLRSSLTLSDECFSWVDDVPAREHVIYIDVYWYFTDVFLLFVEMIGGGGLHKKKKERNAC